MDRAATLRTLRAWLLPKPTRGLVVRCLALAAATALVCRFVAYPVFVRGPSMEPTYAARGFDFVNLLAYRFRAPRRGEVVAVRWAGRRKLLLKRLLAFEGETVEFRDGVCYVDGAPLAEPYVKYDAGWTLPPRTIAPGHVYVMGDNRGVPPDVHVGGETARRRLVGPLLW